MKKKAVIPAILGFVVLSAFVGIWAVNPSHMECEIMTPYHEVTIQDIPLEKWDLLSKKTIYFGHMSVGLNIIDGIKDIMSENPGILLNITELKDSPDIPLNSFCHAPLGYNTKPLEKIHSFQSQMMSFKNTPDIAFMKFCYVDFYAKTEIQRIFDTYQVMVTELQNKFPDTVFMHCTVPLKSGPLTPRKKAKELIKKCLCKPTLIDDNWTRMKFNDLINKTYQPETIIDLAQFESTTSEGAHFFKTKNAVKIPFLYEKFSSDGGHLNETGRKRVAEQLLIHLANCP